MTQKQYGSYPTTVFEFKDDPESWVEIREASWREDRRRSELWRKTEFIYTDANTGETRQRTGVCMAEVQEMECFLTFVDNNILGPEGKPLFKKGMNEKNFLKAIGKLPSPLVREWHDFVLERNPQWGPLPEGG